MRVFSTLESKSQSKSLTWILDFDLGQVTEALCVLVWCSDSCMCKMLIFCTSRCTYFSLSGNVNPRDYLFFFKTFFVFSFSWPVLHTPTPCIFPIPGCFVPICCFSTRSQFEEERSWVLPPCLNRALNWVFIVAATGFVIPEFTGCLSFGYECFSFSYRRNS